MKKPFILIIGVLVVLVGVTSQTYGNDLNIGFAGIKWGASIATQPTLKHLGENDEVAYYWHPDRVFNFEGEQLKEIIYGFYKDSFFAAYINIDAPELFSKLKVKLEDTFGDYKTKISTKDNLTTYQWIYQDIKIKLKHWESSGKMKMSFYYLPISKQINENEQESFQTDKIRLVPIEKGKKPEKWILFEW